MYKIVATLLAAALGLAAGSLAHGQSPFTYQGWLNDGGRAANGVYQMKFTMHAVEIGGGVLGAPLTEAAVMVSNGLFTATLDFGEGMFNGNRRWLEIAVATNGAAEFTTLTPRQEIRPAPYAVRAGSLEGQVGPHAIVGYYGESVQFINPANVFAGDGTGLTNIQALTLEGLTRGDFWQLGGNSGTFDRFVGTLDEQPLELRANNRCGLRLEPAFNGTLNVIAGNDGATFGPTLGTTIAGGEGNQVWAAAFSLTRGATIAGGTGNQAQGRNSTIAGGETNQIWARRWGTISGGMGNQSGAESATIAGGTQNYIFGDDLSTPQSDGASIGGGRENAVIFGGQNGTIAGGLGNTISGSDGYNYRIPGATIGGGTSNLVSAPNATIPGGMHAVADNYGQFAYASGSFHAPGDAQTSMYICRGATSDEIQKDLFLDGVSRRMSLPPNSTWTFEILVSGRAASGNSASYRISGAAKNHDGVTTLFGKLRRKTIAEDDATWDATASAPGTDNTLAVQVTGAKGTPIRWVATVTTSEVSY